MVRASSAHLSSKLITVYCKCIAVALASDSLTVYCPFFLAGSVYHSFVSGMLQSGADTE